MHKHEWFVSRAKDCVCFLAMRYPESELWRFHPEGSKVQTFSHSLHNLPLYYSLLHTAARGNAVPSWSVQDAGLNGRRLCKSRGVGVHPVGRQQHGLLHGPTCTQSYAGRQCCEPGTVVCSNFLALSQRTTLQRLNWLLYTFSKSFHSN